MKNIDELLGKNPPKPKNELNAHFTQNIVAAIQNQSNLTLWQKIHRFFQGQTFRKACAASLAGLMLLSGTAAAIALWPKPTVTTTMTKLLPSGNRIVGYDAENCNYFSGLNGEAPKLTNEKLYYEVREGSLLTDQQLQAALRGACEENISNNAVSAVVKQLAADSRSLLSTQALTVDAITKESITLSLDPKYERDNYSESSVTYTNFADNLIIYNQGDKAAYGDIRAGDTVKLVVRDASGKSTETPEGYNPFSHPEKITVVGMIKIPPLSADPSIFYRAIGTDIVRLTPCTDSLTGFCRVYDFTP